MGLLDRILAQKRREIEALELAGLPEFPERRPIRLKRAAGERLRLITEIKLRSPSAGELSRVLGVGERARCYARAGADMLSVLCDQSFFDGSFEHLGEARRATTLPILCKEFIIDERQLLVARAFGADAALLIVRCLAPSELVRLMERARQLELLPFVEVAGHEEARLAVDAGAELVGVNARDLDTLAIDLERAAEILESLPDSVCKVHLSAVSSPDAVRRVAQSRADAALIGEVLMRQDDPRPLLEALVGAALNSPGA